MVHRMIMKRFLECFSFLVLLSFSSILLAGELIYRDGVGGVNCSVSSNVVEQTADYGNGIQITTMTTRTLTCSGKLIAKHIQICDGYCSGRRKIFSSEHDFSFNIPGIKSEDVVFGSVSVKSAANVFAVRNLGKNYLAYSIDGILAFAAGKKVNVYLDASLPIRGGMCQVSFIDVIC